jgi:1,4-alpha-glucan branching enzyme
MTTKSKVKKTNQEISREIITDDDMYLFNEGSHYRIYDKLGSHPMTVDGVEGTFFAVWAPNAEAVFVIGQFNDWRLEEPEYALEALGSSGIWGAFIPGVKKGDIYKYWIKSRYHGYRVQKTDPVAVHYEAPPRTASVVWDLDYEWNDQEWMEKRYRRNTLEAPMSVYEVHLGSWMRANDGNGENRFLSYREAAHKLAGYVAEMGFTHIEFLPLTEHPFEPSWGYQTVGYFAPTARFGTPQDFMYMIDVLHQHDIGVIMDWVPSHFPTDEHGLNYFDGTHLYEHSDPRKGFHPDWKSSIFNYGRHEVQSFLLSSALYWFDKYHIDGLRVDAVASMLYLDYSRQQGEWIPNQWGGNENIEAIEFLRRMNTEIYKNYPDVQTIAEESTAWPMVSRPTYIGGLGFGMKWDMGWMHDTLSYMSKDSVFRHYHHNQLSFRMLYAFSENFILPLSHDEVVHGKGSLIGKMPGDYWQKFANLRALFGYMYAQAAKKLLFMGGEFAQFAEWSEGRSLDWHLLDYPMHEGMRKFVKDLNQLYKSEPALFELDCDPSGFEWVDANDAANSVVSFLRRGSTTGDQILFVGNFTPVPRYNYRVGVPCGGYWRELLNSDAGIYGGSGMGNFGGVEAQPVWMHNHPMSLNLTLPPLSALFFKCEG